MSQNFLGELSKLLNPGFKPGFLQRDSTVFQFDCNHDEPFHLLVSDTDYELQPGVHNSPTLTVYVPSRTICQELLLGRLDGMDAFMSGNYRADGNIVLSQLLLYLFKVTSSPNIYEVQD